MMTLLITLAAVSLAALLTYLHKKSLSYTLQSASLMLCFCLFVIAFHAWEVFLDDHIVARFNAQGMPAQFSRSGLWLIIDAWPIWAMPAFICATASALLAYLLAPKQIQRIKEIITEVTVPEHVPASSSTVSDKLEIQRLQHALNIAEEKCRLLQKQQAPGSHQVDRYVKELRDTRRELSECKRQYEQIQITLQNSEAELARAQQMIDDLTRNN